MEISATTVKTLRERTGAGMMECKKALITTAGDIEKAIDLMRTSGIAKAATKANRIAAEGVIALARIEQSGVRTAPGLAAMVEVNFETDFVSRDDQFQAFAGRVLSSERSTRPSDVAARRAAQLDSARDGLVQASARTSPCAVSRSCVRRRRGCGLPSRQPQRRTRGARGWRCGRQLPTISPCTSRRAGRLCQDADVPQALAREREMFRAQAMESGKPPEIVEKMVEGRVRTNSIRRDEPRRSAVRQRSGATRRADA